MSVIPIILSGGSGTRLWPLSRKSKPKQFLKFGSDKTLFQDTVLRSYSEIFDPCPIVVGADDHRFLIAEDLLEIDIKADILLEPMPRNSCAAIAAGCLQALKRSEDAVVLVLAADHKIDDLNAFEDAVVFAREAADAGHLVTFGVQPTRPATGYGYIHPGEALKLGACAKVDAFVEKPNEDLAERYVDEGYLWNSGNFLFRADAFLKELEVHAPEILASVKRAVEEAKSDLDFLRLDSKAFESAPSISVDYAVMEKTDKAAVFPVDYTWSDVGSWDAVWDVLEKSEDGNAISGDVHIIAGKNNLVHSHGKLTTLVGIEDTVVVSTRDCVLVASKAHSEHVKSLVTELQQAGRLEANEALQIFRPWGNYEQLDIGEKFQVKRIVINPGGMLSLQKHKHRAEHWVVVQGEVEVTIDDDVRILKPNQSVYVPLGSIHRLANRQSEPVVLIEVQTGDYLGEDDIIRLEDTYNRTSESGVSDDRRSKNEVA
jgi:mannose-1-phosphate guanylyltransferase/mannose-6-phosphate isomerase